MMPSTYVILNENTLGSMNPAFGDSTIQVLAGSVLKGGHDWRNGAVCYLPGIDDIRPATLVDFEEYRVCSKGHFSA